MFWVGLYLGGGGGGGGHTEREKILRNDEIKRISVRNIPLQLE